MTTLKITFVSQDPDHCGWCPLLTKNDRCGQDGGELDKDKDGLCLRHGGCNVEKETTERQVA